MGDEEPGRITLEHVEAWQKEVPGPEQIERLRTILEGAYRHFKLGKRYLVTDVVWDTEANHLKVAYKENDGDPRSVRYVRPLSMFIERVKHEGQTVDRFQQIDYFYRADGNCICESCGQEFHRHPLDGEMLSGINGRPWLHVLCNGDRVHT